MQERYFLRECFLTFEDWLRLGGRDLSTTSKTRITYKSGMKYVDWIKLPLKEILKHAPEAEWELIKGWEYVNPKLQKAVEETTDVVLWDRQENEEVLEYDIADGIVYIKELYCTCNPADGATCGGCKETVSEYKLGERFVFKKKREQS